MKKQLLSLLLLLLPVLLAAQSLTIEPPRSAEIGVPVQLRYHVDADVDVSTFKLQLPAGRVRSSSGLAGAQPMPAEQEWRARSVCVS